MANMTRMMVGLTRILYYTDEDNDGEYDENDGGPHENDDGHGDNDEYGYDVDCDEKATTSGTYLGALPSFGFMLLQLELRFLLAAGPQHGPQQVFHHPGFHVAPTATTRINPIVQVARN